jgi:hypothetical protein
MRIKAQAVVAAIVAIGIGPAELSFAGQDVASAPEVSAEVFEASAVAVQRSRTQLRRTLIDSRTRLVRHAADFDRLDRAMATGSSLVVA